MSKKLIFLFLFHQYIDAAIKPDIKIYKRQLNCDIKDVEVFFDVAITICKDNGGFKKSTADTIDLIAVDCTQKLKLEVNDYGKYCRKSTEIKVFESEYFFSSIITESITLRRYLNDIS